MDNTCDTCKWWEPFDETEADMGWCRRYPPNMLSPSSMIQLGAHPGWFMREDECSMIPTTHPARH